QEQRGIVFNGKISTSPFVLQSPCGSRPGRRSPVDYPVLRERRGREDHLGLRQQLPPLLGPPRTTEPADVSGEWPITLWLATSSRQAEGPLPPTTPTNRPPGTVVQAAATPCCGDEEKTMSDILKLSVRQAGWDFLTTEPGREAEERCRV